MSHCLVALGGNIGDVADTVLVSARMFICPVEVFPALTAMSPVSQTSKSEI